jgi:gas vesicle protein
MTAEERLDRIEHLTAGIAEERRKDRDEYKGLWRDTQRQLNEVGAKLVQLSEETQEANSRLEARIEQLAEESRAADRRLEERIASLLSGIGEFIAKGGK